MVDEAFYETSIIRSDRYYSPKYEIEMKLDMS